MGRISDGLKPGQSGPREIAFDVCQIDQVAATNKVELALAHPTIWPPSAVGIANSPCAAYGKIKRLQGKGRDADVGHTKIGHETLLSSLLVGLQHQKEEEIESEAKLGWTEPLPRTGCVLPASIEIATSLTWIKRPTEPSRETELRRSQRERRRKSASSG